MNKSLPQVGDMHITGIVNMSGFMEIMVLQNTRLNLVMNMANIVSKGIKYNMWKFQNKRQMPTTNQYQFEYPTSNEPLILNGEGR